MPTHSIKITCFVKVNLRTQLFCLKMSKPYRISYFNCKLFLDGGKYIDPGKQPDVKRRRRDTDYDEYSGCKF